MNGVRCLRKKSIEKSKNIYSSLHTRTNTYLCLYSNIIYIRLLTVSHFFVAQDKAALESLSQQLKQQAEDKFSHAMLDFTMSGDSDGRQIHTHSRTHKQTGDKTSVNGKLRFHPPSLSPPPRVLQLTVCRRPFLQKVTLRELGWI